MASMEPELAAASGSTGPISIDLGDGLTIMAAPSVVVDTDLREVGWRHGVNADEFFDSIRSLATRLTEALKAAAPTKISAEFGITASIKSGKLTALLVEGTGEATIKVSVEWDRSKTE
jgi:hypothetical protein